MKVKLIILLSNGENNMANIVICLKCKGKGLRTGFYFFKRKCRHCKGYGIIKKKRII